MVPLRPTAADLAFESVATLPARRPPMLPVGDPAFLASEPRKCLLREGPPELDLPCRLWATFRDCPSRILGPPCRTVELSCSRIPGLVPDVLSARDAEQVLPCRLRATFRDCPSRILGPSCRTVELSCSRIPGLVPDDLPHCHFRESGSCPCQTRERRGVTADLAPVPDALVGEGPLSVWPPRPAIMLTRDGSAPPEGLLSVLPSRPAVMP